MAELFDSALMVLGAIGFGGGCFGAGCFVMSRRRRKRRDTEVEAAEDRIVTLELEVERLREQLGDRPKDASLGGPE